MSLPQGGYLEYLYDLDEAAVAQYRGLSASDFAIHRTSAPLVQDVLRSWDELYRAPFRGVTTDGTVRDDLYPLPLDARPAGGTAARAAHAALALLSEAERIQVVQPLEAPTWRAWSNPEFIVHRVGLRLEELTPAKVDALWAIVAASLSPEGVDRVREVMALNGFLGDLVGLPAVMNDRSYWFALYGTPAPDEPWGWQLFGHHLALNVAFVGGREVIAPVFLGAEPAISDGLRPHIFEERERLALQLVGSLTETQRLPAIVYPSVLDTAMPPGRVHPFDERHVAGAFQDNRIVPYEGICATQLADEQYDLLRRVVADFLLLLPEEERRATLADIDHHRRETHFAWYGAIDGAQPFYFRIHSPVVLAELDHHAGVWLTNVLPARFHIHTTLRFPNGNDYGMAYRRHRRTENERIDDV